ncbi:hypothetical protein BDV19DRAFT_392099 [Aspergillus venezuelensis]
MNEGPEDRDEIDYFADPDQPEDPNDPCNVDDSEDIGEPNEIEDSDDPSKIEDSDDPHEIEEFNNVEEIEIAALPQTQPEYFSGAEDPAITKKRRQAEENHACYVK